ncbi:response regulator transcription factor [Pseudarthrobacter sp. S9]|uniref:response regulator transcription factor n=1 Tax=Pseudarthrobacter sp. S9 TaxID=3418421 RepID=UPI003D02F7AD
MLCLILSRAGFDVHAEATGTAGLRAALGLDLDLITLDLGLPDLNGHDVAGRLRKESDAPILVITSWTGPGDQMDALAAGADAYLTKPFRTARLAELIQQLCPQEPVPAPPAGRAPVLEQSAGQG